MPEPPPLQTLETRLERIEAMLHEIHDHLDAQDDRMGELRSWLEEYRRRVDSNWGKRLNDVRLRYDGQHDRLEARIAAVEKIIT